MENATTSAAAPSNNNDVFCIGPGWSMRNEFEVAIGPDKHCVLLFSMSGNSPSAYAGLVIFSFFMTFSIELLGFVRKWFHKNYLSPKKGKNVAPPWLHYVGSCLYGLMLSCSYLAMLIAMAYETVCFIFLIIGFVCGHAVFSVYLPQREKQLKLKGAAADNVDESPLMAAAVGIRRTALSAGDDGDELAAENSTPCCGGTKRWGADDDDDAA